MMKKLLARDIMVKDYGTIRPDAPVKEAVQMIFRGKVRESGYKPFGVLVTDDINRLIGMVSMYDILYHLRPTFMNYDLDSLRLWNHSEDLEHYLDHFQSLRIEQIMSTPVLCVAPDNHLMDLIDLMVKKKARRLPVLEEDRLIGVVYLSDVFYSLCKNWLQPD